MDGEGIRICFEGKAKQKLNIFTANRLHVTCIQFSHFRRKKPTSQVRYETKVQLKEFFTLFYNLVDHQQLGRARLHPGVLQHGEGGRQGGAECRQRAHYRGAARGLGEGKILQNIFSSNDRIFSLQMIKWLARSYGLRDAAYHEAYNTELHRQARTVMV